MKGGLDFFGNSAKAVKGVVGEVVKAAGEAVDKAIEHRQWEQRASWVGWRIVRVGEGQFAAVMKNCEHERFPISGWVDFQTLKQFIIARENEPVF